MDTVGNVDGRHHGHTEALLLYQITWITSHECAAQFASFLALSQQRYTPRGLMQTCWTKLSVWDVMLRHMWTEIDIEMIRDLQHRNAEKKI